MDPSNMSSFVGPVDEFTESPVSAGDVIIVGPHENFTCNQYIRHNSTFIVYGGYEGVPMNLGANLLGWTLLIVLFSLLRKSAWNYGRLALVHKNERRWTQLFYGNEESSWRLWAQNPESMQMGDVMVDRGIFSWMVAIFNIRDDDILRKCGSDALQYLSFQRHIIAYLLLTTLVAIGVVLPVNYQGTLNTGAQQSFAQTTISNLPYNSRWLWLHATLAVLFLPLAIGMMRRFSAGLNISSEQGGESSSLSRTLMITNVPRAGCNRNGMLKHFQEAYPSAQLDDVQFCYNISRLMNLDQRRDAMFQARVYCDDHLASTGERLSVRPYICGNVCCCCTQACGCRQVDAIEHYSREESRLVRQVEIEKAVALNQPLGIAFVMFKSKEMAARVLREHDHVLRCGQNPPASSVSSLLKSYRWHVRFAPPPEDIYWQNLNHSSFWWYFRSLFVNIILFLVLFFLTTPILIANAVEKLWITDRVKSTSPLVSEFLPTLLLWTFAALMPVLVSFSDRFIFHWTRSSENLSIMTKTFIFLLFMVLILPSLGLSSARALVEWMARPTNETRWDCVFMPDNGAFFVNYVITSAFIGTGLEIIRFPELFMYAFRMCLARSQAEIASVRTAILWEFPFGTQYAWMLLIFALTVVYSLLSPLIAPFGLLYMILKHLVDRHNIYYAYGRSRIKKRIHTTAINFVILSVFMTQLCLCLFSYSRQNMNGITIYSLVGLSITLSIFLAHVFFHWFNQCSPIRYSSFGDSVESGDDCSAVDNGSGSANDGSASRGDAENHTFVPSVLLRAPQVRVRDTGDVYTYPSLSVDGGATGGGDGKQAMPRRRSYGSSNQETDSAEEAGRQRAVPSTSAPSSQLYQNYNQGGRDQLATAAPAGLARSWSPVPASGADDRLLLTDEQQV